MKAVLLICIFAAVYAGNTVSGHTDTKQDQKKVICYFTNWATYRPGNGRFIPSNIDGSLCTHVLYSFALLHSTSLTIVPADPEMDINQGFYRQVTALKDQGVKVLIAIGGWNDSADSKYSRMVNNSTSRANFVQSVVQFIGQHNFDGLDLDWEYPTCWQGDCEAGPPSDKTNFVNLVRELRSAFQPRGWLVSSAVSASRNVGDHAYDIPALSENLDWIGLMTYDYRGGYDGRTGHHSPLRGGVPNVVDTVDYWLSEGASPDKLILGVPLYGRSFTLVNPGSNVVGSPATTGTPGQFTREAGFLAYYELCTGWTQRHVAMVGPYAYRGDQWTSYDNVQIIQDKIRFIETNGLAGAMVWALDLDDFNNSFCGTGRYPLLTALRNGLV